MTRLAVPRPIDAADDVAGFDCGEPVLDQWLLERAVRNERGGASRTFVSLDLDAGAVAGYYCLSASSLRSEEATGRLRRNTANPIPVILIGRLAVDRRYGGLGLGASMLQDAVLKALEASRLVGARAVLVHALSESAQNFYEHFGFTLVPGSARVLHLLLADAEKTILEVPT